METKDPKENEVKEKGTVNLIVDAIVNCAFKKVIVVALLLSCAIVFSILKPKENNETEVQVGNVIEQVIEDSIEAETGLKVDI